MVFKAYTTPTVLGDYPGPPSSVVRELRAQLDSWRTLLPKTLQWADYDGFGLPEHVSQRQKEPIQSFVTNQPPTSDAPQRNADIATAQLQTRFYHARFLIYRSFVYKVLHFPQSTTAEDRMHCALAIKFACVWPLTMAPCKHKKRLVPHLFPWTQNFFSILLIFRICSVSDDLQGILIEHEMLGFQNIQLSTTLMLEWVKDVGEVDGVAEWSQSLLQTSFAR